MRLQVFLSRNGVCSRRKAMDVIKAGKVRVNGKIIAEPSTPVDPGKDEVTVNGKRVGSKSYGYILLNKPAGYVTTKQDPFAEKTVLDLLPKKFHHLSPVGRLDKDTEGLLLLTNDGDIAYRLTHPKFNIDKTYFVRIDGRLSPEDQKCLEKGIVVDEQQTAPAKIKNLKTASGGAEFYLTIHEGRKRQIRHMMTKLGKRVVYLKRIVHGPLELGSLKRGKFRALTEKEMKDLRIKGSKDQRIKGSKFSL